MKKQCSACGQEKPLDDFFKDKKNNGARGQGRQSACKECTTARTRAWRDRHPDYDKTYHQARAPRLKGYYLQKRYGITQEDFDALLAQQGGLCRICKTSTPGGFANTLHVDHDHQTGKVRGLLCTNCNRGIGYLQEDAAVLRSAIQYLEETTS